MAAKGEAARRGTGDGNFLHFGRAAKEVARRHGRNSPRRPYDKDLETRAALDSVPEPPRDEWLTCRDGYMEPADPEADARLTALHDETEAPARTSISCIAASGKFSGDRAVSECATQIRRAMPRRVR